ncbi:hypothetical protein RP20_CCG016419 [Aedes albopictus]|nr:hypothetical protein RP20_CCG016419 [Aedes albopictus]
METVPTQTFQTSLPVCQLRSYMSPSNNMCSNLSSQPLYKLFSSPSKCNNPPPFRNRLFPSNLIQHQSLNRNLFQALCL